MNHFNDPQRMYNWCPCHFSYSLTLTKLSFVNGKYYVRAKVSWKKHLSATFDLHCLHNIQWHTPLIVGRSLFGTFFCFSICGPWPRISLPVFIWRNNHVHRLTVKSYYDPDLDLLFWWWTPVAVATVTAQVRRRRKSENSGGHCLCPE